jgi:hypothetical protein
VLAIPPHNHILEHDCLVDSRRESSRHDQQQHFFPVHKGSLRIEVSILMQNYTYNRSIYTAYAYDVLPSAASKAAKYLSPNVLIDGASKWKSSVGLLVRPCDGASAV